jgi:hypothetical protein
MKVLLDKPILPGFGTTAFAKRRMSMNSGRFLLISCFSLGFLLMAIIFQNEAQAERKYTSQHLKISVVVLGEYDSGPGSGGFEAFHAGKQISIDFNWTPLKVYSGKKKIKSNIDTFLRGNLTKGKRIEVMGRWTNVITTTGCKVFEVDKINFVPEPR